MAEKRWIPLSAHRRMVVELMRACQGIPLVTVDRRMDLSELASARQRLMSRPAWSVILAKAYALVSVEMPILRTSFMPFPWAHLYLHPEPVAALVVERDWHGELAPFSVLARRPHTQSIADLDAFLRHCKQAPFDSIPSLRRAQRLSRLPWPLRGWMYRLGLNVSGRWREKHCGTFGLTSPASAGAGGLHLISPLTSTLHFGMFDERSSLDLRLTFDHRVFDGAVGARALVALEKKLRGSILDELHSMEQSAVAA